jgi:hypothetical protein
VGFLSSVSQGTDRAKLPLYNSHLMVKMNNMLSPLRLDKESTDMYEQRLQAFDRPTQQVQSREEKISSMITPSVGSYEQLTRPTAEIKSAAPEKMGQASSVFLSELSPLDSDVPTAQLLERLDHLLT